MKVVYITGGASGIGYCLAKEFVKAGDIVIINDVNEDNLNKVKQELGVDTYCYSVGNLFMTNDAIKDTIKCHGKIDILINNAGIGLNEELVDTKISLWKDLMDVNFWGSLYHTYAALHHMKKQGSGQVVNVSSGQAFLKLPTWGAYATSKAALGVFSEILHYEVKKYGIDITSVYPFMVNTPFYSDIHGTDTLAGKLAMKLVPYYSITPEKAARKIYRAVKKKKRVESTHIINDLIFHTQTVPFLPSIVSKAANYFLTNKG